MHKDEFKTWLSIDTAIEKIIKYINNQYNEGYVWYPVLTPMRYFIELGGYGYKEYGERNIKAYIIKLNQNHVIIYYDNDKVVNE